MILVQPPEAQAIIVRAIGLPDVESVLRRLNIQRLGFVFPIWSDVSVLLNYQPMPRSFFWDAAVASAAFQRHSPKVKRRTESPCRSEL